MSNEVKKLVSIVVPCYDEEEVIEAFLDRVRAVAEQLDAYAFEFLFVDDGSRDATAEILAEQASRDDRVRLLSLSRNFGHQRAITAGLDFCAGDFVIVIDADLQDPPELIADILERLSAGADLVHTVRTDRRADSFPKRFTAKLFYALMRRGVLPELPENAGDFKGFNRTVLTALGHYHERVRFLRGVVATLGFTQETLPYTRPVRHAGHSKYPWFNVLRFARDAVVSYSVLPLRVGLVAGVLAWLVLPVYVVGALTRHFLLGGLQAPLLVVLIALVTGFSGLILILLGLMGEYLGCIIKEVKRRPLYIVRNGVNLSRRDRP